MDQNQLGHFLCDLPSRNNSAEEAENFALENFGTLVIGTRVEMVGIEDIHSLSYHQYIQHVF